MSAFRGKADMPSWAGHVCKWPLADITVASANVRFRGKSGRAAGTARLLLMIQSRRHAHHLTQTSTGTHAFALDHRLGVVCLQVVEKGPCRGGFLSFRAECGREHDVLLHLGWERADYV